MPRRAAGPPRSRSSASRPASDGSRGCGLSRSVASGGLRRAVGRRRYRFQAPARAAEVRQVGVPEPVGDLLDREAGDCAEGNDGGRQCDELATGDAGVAEAEGWRVSQVLSPTAANATTKPTIVKMLASVHCDVRFLR